jgi:hypothetical protein
MVIYVMIKGERLLALLDNGSMHNFIHGGHFTVPRPHSVKGRPALGHSGQRRPFDMRQDRPWHGGRDHRRSSIKTPLDLEPVRTKEPLHTSIPLELLFTALAR